MGAGLLSVSKEKYPLEDRDSKEDLLTKMKSGDLVAKGPGLAGGASGPCGLPVSVLFTYHHSLLWYFLYE